MPSFDVVLTIGEHENVASVAPASGRTWPMRVRCVSCNETTERFIFVDPAEQCETDGGGVRNSVFKCGFCKNTITLDVVIGSHRALDVATAVENGREARGVVLTVEARGGEPEELRLDDQWVVISAGGMEFSETDLSDDWCDFDEKAAVPVNLAEISVEFTKARGKK